MYFHLLNLDPLSVNIFSKQIADLYSRMENAYRGVSDFYNFNCTGCLENCCEERFYHYTLSEIFYFSIGISTLDEQKRYILFQRAEKVMSLYREHDSMGKTERVMCPVNEGGLCGLYEYRLMICHLHGVPHTIRRPGSNEQTWPGCDRFHSLVSPDRGIEKVLDRTAFYSEMSNIEIMLRKTIGFSGRIKKTIAEIILDIKEGLYNENN